MIHHGDCLEVMAAMGPESVDAIVTDPPYGLEFMGKEWDRLGDIGQTSHAGPPERSTDSDPFSRTRISYFGSSNLKCRKCRKWQWDHVGRKCECEQPDFPNRNRHQGLLMQQWHEAWAREAFRVAKPGAYLLSFGGTRTYHRMACAIEDAGWIIRDCLVWAYASGFPKSKALLKPAWEPIVMARKPGPLRELAIDACRIGTEERWTETGRSAHGGTSFDGATGTPFGNTSRLGEASASTRYGDRGVGFQPLPGPRGGDALGRWPANVVLTDPIFDGDTPGVVGGGEASTGSGWAGAAPSRTELFTGVGGVARENYTDTGTYSRFFIVPKAARGEREPILPSGLRGELRTMADGANGRGPARPILRENTHPTVKPLDLMRHLVRLVTPAGGTVLDPFLGSGTTGIAAELEGFPWLGIEREAEYVAIAEARLNGTQRGLGI